MSTDSESTSKSESQLPTVNLGSESLLRTQASSTPSINASDNTSATPDSELQIIEVREETRSEPLEIPPLALSLPSSLKEELIKDDFIYVPSESQTQQTSDNENTEPEPPMNVPPKQQQKEEAPVAWQLQEEAQPDFAAHPRQREDDIISTNSPSQPTQPSELTISQLEILEEAVVDAGVTAALKFAEATTVEPTFIAAETKDSSNEYDAILVLKHEASYEGVRQHFMSLIPKEQVESMVVTIHSMILNEIKGHRFQEQIYIVPLDIVMFMLGNYGMDYIDPRTKKAYQFDIDQYADHRRFLDKRKLASHPFKKKFYVLDPVNKKKKDILESRVKLNKFIMRVYAGAEPLMEDGEGEEAEYIMLNGQRIE
ncbi:uncharacterized protein DS421_16g534370 [Arachis hypogaea]|nr:uncharacterized protein DS421_16g534370 [Arachis hypogaea]